MSRVVIHTAQGPAIVKTQNGDTVAICRCGLTTNPDGTCCGNHKRTLDEKPDHIYQYDDKLEREELAEDQDCDCHHCQDDECDCECDCDCDCDEAAKTSTPPVK